MFLFVVPALRECFALSLWNKKIIIMFDIEITFDAWSKCHRIKPLTNKGINWFKKTYKLECRNGKTVDSTDSLIYLIKDMERDYLNINNIAFNNTVEFLDRM